ncbi:MAG: O-antigen ligase family protein [Kofleriaceae bacterium]
MFAIPGIAALIVFILARPQEFFVDLQRVPFLHIFTALAVLGWVIDVRLRRLQPMGVPTLPWVGALLLWAFLGMAVVAPAQFIQRGIELAILFALYGTIAHGVQKFRTFQIVAGVLTGTCLVISFVCFHQGISPRQCVAGEVLDGEVMGQPDGRSCETVEQCRGPDAEPGKEYRCERVGVFGTYSVQNRVRYRGELHDPNEVGLTIVAGGLSLLIAFGRRRESVVGGVFVWLAVLLVVATVYLTRSRGAQVSLLMVPGVYALRRWGWKALIPMAVCALPVLLFGGRSDANADTSTALRYEAWATGLDMFKNSPIFGVGARLFTEHHFLTAHNSFVLTLAELGFIGMVLFSSVVYLTFKTLISGLIQLRSKPEAHVATVWGMALLASMCGILFQSNTLSFAYHSVLWIFFGLVGAWYSSIKFHLPEFNVRMTLLDFVIVFVSCGFYAFVFLRIFLMYKGEL